MEAWSAGVDVRYRTGSGAGHRTSRVRPTSMVILSSGRSGFVSPRYQHLQQPQSTSSSWIPTAASAPEVAGRRVPPVMRGRHLFGSGTTLHDGGAAAALAMCRTQRAREPTAGHVSKLARSFSSSACLTSHRTSVGEDVRLRAPAASRRLNSRLSNGSGSDLSIVLKVTCPSSENREANLREVAEYAQLGNVPGTGCQESVSESIPADNQNSKSSDSGCESSSLANHHQDSIQRRLSPTSECIKEKPITEFSQISEQNGKSREPESSIKHANDDDTDEGKSNEIACNVVSNKSVSKSRNSGQHIPAVQDRSSSVAGINQSDMTKHLETHNKTQNSSPPDRHTAPDTSDRPMATRKRRHTRPASVPQVNDSNMCSNATEATTVNTSTTSEKISGVRLDNIVGGETNMIPQNTTKQSKNTVDIPRLKTKIISIRKSAAVSENGQTGNSATYGESTVSAGSSTDSVNKEQRNIDQNHKVTHPAMNSTKNKQNTCNNGLPQHTSDGDPHNQNAKRIATYGSCLKSKTEQPMKREMEKSNTNFANIHPENNDVWSSKEQDFMSERPLRKNVSSETISGNCLEVGTARIANCHLPAASVVTHASIAEASCQVNALKPPAKANIPSAAVLSTCSSHASEVEQPWQQTADEDTINLSANGEVSSTAVNQPADHAGSKKPENGNMLSESQGPVTLCYSQKKTKTSDCNRPSEAKTMLIETRSINTEIIEMDRNDTGNTESNEMDRNDIGSTEKATGAANNLQRKQTDRNAYQLEATQLSEPTQNAAQSQSEPFYEPKDNSKQSNPAQKDGSAGKISKTGSFSSVQELTKRFGLKGNNKLDITNNNCNTQNHSNNFKKPRIAYVIHPKPGVQLQLAGQNKSGVKMLIGNNSESQQNIFGLNILINNKKDINQNNTNGNTNEMKKTLLNNTKTKQNNTTDIELEIMNTNTVKNQEVKDTHKPTKKLKRPPKPSSTLKPSLKLTKEEKERRAIREQQERDMAKKIAEFREQGQRTKLMMEKLKMEDDPVAYLSNVTNLKFAFMIKQRELMDRQKQKDINLSQIKEPTSGTPHLDSDVTDCPAINDNLDPLGGPRPKYKTYTVDDFKFFKVLGRGAFGKVMLARMQSTHNYFAVKCLRKDRVVSDEDVEDILTERKVLGLATSHPYLCNLFCTFQTSSHLFFVLEFLNGGDLNFHLHSLGRFTPEMSVFYAAEIVCGLRFLHRKGIIYRDLKLDNALLDHEGHIRLADFGMCMTRIFLDRTAHAFCGTVDYMAPEVVTGKNYNQSVDWWSFGVMLYEMVVGLTPFFGLDEQELFWSIRTEQPYYPRFLATEAADIIKRFLVKEPEDRLGSPECSAGTITGQPYFRSVDWHAVENKKVQPPFIPKLKNAVDCRYFEQKYTDLDPSLTEVPESSVSGDQRDRFSEFNYTNPNITD